VGIKDGDGYKSPDNHDGGSEYKNSLHRYCDVPAGDRRGRGKVWLTPNDNVAVKGGDRTVRNNPSSLQRAD